MSEMLTKTIDCDMVVELECGCVVNGLLPLRESPSKLRLFTFTECNSLMAKLTIGDDPNSVNWQHLVDAMRSLLESADLNGRVFEGLYAWDKLEEFHAALRAIASTAISLPVSSLESLAAYSDALILCQFLERQYNLAPVQTDWACECSAAAKDLVDKLLESAFSADSAAAAEDAPALRDIVCADGPGVALLEGAGVYFGSQLVAAQAVGAVTPEQYVTGGQRLAAQLPTVALEVAEWLAHSLHAGVGADPTQASGIAGLTVLAEMVSASKQGSGSSGAAEGGNSQGTSDASAQLAKLTLAVLEGIATPALQRCSNHLAEGHSTTLFGSSASASAAIEGRERSSSGAMDGENVENANSSISAQLRASVALLTIDTVGALVRIAQDCGVELFVRAAVDELVSGVNFEAMCKIADIAAVVAISVDGGQLNTIRPVFSDVLPSACQSITQASHGVALASLAIRLVAALLSVAAAADGVSDDTVDSEPPKKRQRKGTKPGSSSRADDADTDGDGDGDSNVAAEWCSLEQPAAEIGMLTTLMCDLLNNGPSPALAFPVALAKQAGKCGPRGILPGSLVGTSLRASQKALAFAFRLYNKTEYAAPFFDLTASASAEDAAALYRMRPLPLLVVKPLPFIPSLSEASGGYVW